jgi:hypothetical protein
MALLLQEGFEHVRSSTDVLRRFPEANTAVPSTLPTKSGRLYGSRCLNCDNTTFTFRTASLGASSARILMGFSYKVHKPIGAWAQVSIVNSSNAEQLSLHSIVSTTGYSRIALYRGGTLLGLSQEFVDDVYVFVELDALIDASAGDWTLRINEMTVATGTGNTAAAGGSGFSKIVLNPKTQSLAGNYVDIDDLYVCDGSAVWPNRLLGAVGIEALAPNQAGVSNDWLPSAAVAHYTLVDDGATGGADDDTTYLDAPATDDDLEMYYTEHVSSLYGGMICERLSADVKNSSGATDQGAFTSLHDSTFVTGDTFAIPSGGNYLRVKLDMVTNTCVPPDLIYTSQFGFSNFPALNPYEVYGGIPRER